MANFVQKIRWSLHSKAIRSRVTNAAGIDADDTTMDVPADHLKRFHIGNMIEWDDGTDERAEVTDTDETLNRVSLLRAQEGTTGAPHALNATVLIEPDYSYIEIGDALSDLVLLEFWPWVWIPSETTLPWEADGHLSPSVSDIEEIAFAYQVMHGEVIPIGHTWLSPQSTDATNFPRGLLIVEGDYNATVYAAYRARATVANLTDPLLRLASLGVQARMAISRELALVAPDTTAGERQVQPGSRRTAGSVLWDRFEADRDQEKIRLEENEERQREQLGIG